MAMWVDGAAEREQSAKQEMRPATAATALAVSSVATAAGLAVLIAGTRVHLSTLAAALAGVTLLAAAARSQLAFRLLGRMADLRRRAAITDELTGLPNRRALYAEGQTRLVNPQHPRRALLMMDLNKFKEVNDSLGHHTGDLLLVQVGARLRETLRADDVLARLGGDEFAALLEDAGHDEATDVATKLAAALAESFVLDGVTLHSSMSIGIALFPDDGADLSALLRKADIAMYRAKTSGGGHHVYCSTDDAEDTTRLQTVQELRTALTDGQLVVARAAALVASTIALAHSLGLRMVAEGVETHVAYAELTRLGCDQAQGYYMSRPVPAVELDHWLSTRRPADQPTAIPPTAILRGHRLA